MHKMRSRHCSALFTAVVTTGVLTAAPAFAAKSPPPPNGTDIGGCTTTLPSPGAIDCAGYYTGNILNGSDTDILNQQNAITSLDGDFTWNGNWTFLDNSTSPDYVITALANGNQLNFGTTLYGQTIVGAHFGNITGDAGNVSVFWLFDFGNDGRDYITLTNTQGFSNAALYTTGLPGGVPEPAVWAMMLVGFGAVGFQIRRRRMDQAFNRMAIT